MTAYRITIEAFDDGAPEVPPPYPGEFAPKWDLIWPRWHHPELAPEPTAEEKAIDEAVLGVLRGIPEFRRRHRADPGTVVRTHCLCGRPLEDPVHV